MDKKQKISWGVSFGSLALVAGMVSYFGLSTGGQTNNKIAFNQGQPANNNSIQPSQDDLSTQQRPGHGQGFDQSFTDDNSSQFNQNDGSTNNFDNNDQSTADNEQFYGNSNQQGQFSNGGGPEMGHQGGYDTTTGGT
ncbi:hypothetical protein KW850_18905 [Bacillus sp. sid0103]|uniref:hypothetical protein n=1 Tax=Bacillus sp. sid0103 TaxID=2856337 RepID=UPI001C4612A1|nr:hypothetical protein [Bacillus sp. sid0103]MBV7507314.1 hypothetical protein [Bacillus sp. sid0103]